MPPMSNRVIRDQDNPGSYLVVSGPTSQSWVDPNDPLRLEFEYVQRIGEALEETVLARSPTERIRVVHVGGGGLTLPRYVEARRPHTAQIVLEPDADLVAEVRTRLPLPRRSGIKIREVDGLTGVAAMPGDYADAVVVDAFAGAQVPGELATAEFFDDLFRVLRDRGLLCMNLTDSAPFAWAKRCVAGLSGRFDHVVVSAEIPVWKGRRFGNLVAVASQRPLPVEAMGRWAARAAFPYRLLWGRPLLRWVGDAVPFSRVDAVASPDPAWGRAWF